MARHSPAANDRPSVHWMDNDRNSKILRFFVNRPELFGIKILVLNCGIANQSAQAEHAHGAVEFLHSQIRLLHGERSQADEFTGMIFHDPAN
jgi:hypothetical protein